MRMRMRMMVLSIVTARLATAASIPLPFAALFSAWGCQVLSYHRLQIGNILVHMSRVIGNILRPSGVASNQALDPKPTVADWQLPAQDEDKTKDVKDSILQVLGLGGLTSLHRTCTCRGHPPLARAVEIRSLCQQKLSTAEGHHQQYA